jgi:hypothetical protein
MVDELNPISLVVAKDRVIDTGLGKSEMVDALGGGGDLRRGFLIVGDQCAYPVTDEGSVSCGLSATLRSQLGRTPLGTVGDRIILTDIEAGCTHLANRLKHCGFALLQLFTATAGDFGGLVQLKSRAPDLDHVEIGALLGDDRGLSLPRCTARGRRSRMDFGENLIPQIASPLKIVGSLAQIRCVQALDLR